MKYYAALSVHLIILSLLTLVEPSSSTFPDWLVHPIEWKTTVTQNEAKEIVLDNGLIARKFSTWPGFTSIDYLSHEKGSSLLRALSPEAVVSINGKTFNVGGLMTKIPRAYLNRTALKEDLSLDPDSFQFIRYEVSPIQVPFPYSPMRGAPQGITWPPGGRQLRVIFGPPEKVAHTSLGAIQIAIDYEMFDGIPLMSKRVSVESNSLTESIKVGIQSSEILALNQQWDEEKFNWIHLQTDEAHGSEIHWSTDPGCAQEWGSFCPMVNATFQQHFEVALKAGDLLESPRTLELIIGSDDLERRGLAQRKMLRLLAPQTQENPIYFHITTTSSPAFRKAVDQLAEVGFEMILYSFGSHWNLESNTTAFLDGLRSDVAYANSLGIEVGGYDLIALTRVVQDDWRSIAPDGTLTNNACFASTWNDHLLAQVLDVIEYTNISVLETDGPFGGYTCSSTSHKHHEGYLDSIYQQNRLQGKFYTELRKRNVYINQPDTYFYQGGSKTGMGYNEEQYSLPRWMDLSISRQSVFDATYHYIPSVGWMFLPLEVYHGGGKAAMFEPLDEHLQEYEWGLAQYLGAGVAACYRGLRIYDSDRTKALVQKWVDFYRRHREILNSDIIHVRRPDMQSIDCFMHVNPRLEHEKGLIMFFNPTREMLQSRIRIPLYYSGLAKRARVVWENGTEEIHQLDRQFGVELTLRLAPMHITWAIVK